MAVELLLKVKDGSKQGNIKLKDVEDILANDDFTAGEGLLATTENGSTLLHLAAICNDEKVLPLVCQAYIRAKFFPRVMVMRNEQSNTPLHLAIKEACFANAMLLYKGCQDLCPEALNPYENGWTLMHSAVNSTENVNLVRFFLSQDKCVSMLLSQYTKPNQKNPRPVLPLDLAKDLVQNHEFYVNYAETSFKNMIKAVPAFNNDYQYNFIVGGKKKALEKAKELLSFIQQPTMELQAEENKRLAMELEKQKILERKNQVHSEIDSLLQVDNWEEVRDKYLLTEIEETQKITMNFLAQKLGSSDESPFYLPYLSENILKILMKFLKLSAEDLISSLKFLEVYTEDVKNNTLIIEQQESLPVISVVLDIMCSVDADLQCLCASTLSNFYSHLPENSHGSSDDSDVIEPLLLVKHFSLYERARVLAVEALKGLKVDSMKEPDPGTWNTRQVSFWMESNTEIDCRSEYSRSFFDAGINGLHLLELSSAEMTGLGVKFLSHQRKLSALIDDLRRRNKRSMVGKKDIFLSYAHIDIKFGQRIKKALNDANYTVWIDQAGIRAGNKWRNEIADGIQTSSCIIFILTPRAANSEYCRDEIGLAEEYHKPIITLKHKEVSEMDPGLKLVLQRRQWIDFTEESSFGRNEKSLLDAIHRIIGDGSGPEIEGPPVQEIQHEPHVTVLHNQGHSVEESNGLRQLLTVELGQVREEIRQVREEMRLEISRLNTRLEQLLNHIKIEL